MSDTNQPAGSPVIPVQYDASHVIRFRCHKGVSCFNACCQSIDISLTPYDILRLKNRLGLDSMQFLAQYTVPYQIDKDGLPGVKLRQREDSTACQFVTDEGCSVYEDRPAACRYYPVGLLALRKAGQSVDEDHYVLVQEEHCKGWEEDRELTIGEYRKEQGLEEYDEHSRGWRQLLLKKMSAGPAVGKPSKRSLQLFFLVCYNLDTFRELTLSEAFRASYDLSADEWARLEQDELELLKFGYRLLRQVLFGEQSIPVRQEAVEQRYAERREQIAKRLDEQKPQTVEEFHDPNYDSAPES
jgi:uncharacterized protein